MARAVPRPYLRQTVVNGEWVAVRARGHVAVGERFGQAARWERELPEQDAAQTAFLCLDDSAGVMGDESAKHVVGLLDVAQVPGSVERVKASVGQLGGVADVMEPGCGFEQVGIFAEDRFKRAGLPSDALTVRPAARQWNLQQLAGDLLGPVGLLHDPTLSDSMADAHGRGWAVPGRLGESVAVY